MTSKLKKMGVILCVGATLVFLGSVGIFNSGAEMADIWKTVLISILAIFLIALSCISAKSFGLAKFDDYILGTGFATLVCAYISCGAFQLFGEYLSFKGEGYLIFLASIFILMSILSVLMKVKTKAFFFYDIAYAFLTVGMFFGIVHITDDASAASLVIPTMLLAANIVSLFIKKFSLFSIITFLSIGFGILPLLAGPAKFAVAYFIITAVSLMLLTKKSKDNWWLIIPELAYALNTIFVYISLTRTGLDIEAAFLIIGLLTILYDSIFVYISGKKIFGYNVLNKIITCFILFAVIVNLDLVELIIFSVIMLSSSCILGFVVKEDTVEKYLLPYKLFASISAILGLVGIDVVYSDIIANVIASCSILLISNKKMIGVLDSIIILTLLDLLITDSSLLSFILCIVVSVFDYISLFVIKKRPNGVDTNKAFFIVLLFYLLINVIRVDISDYKYLISAIAYTTLFVISYKDKLLAGFSLGFTVGSLLLFVYSMDISYTTTIINMITFGTMFALAYSVCDTKEKRIEFISIFSIIFFIINGLLGIRYGVMEVPFAVAYLIEAVTMLLYSNYVNNKTIFNTSLVATAFIIIRMLFTIEGIPTAVVVTLTGLIIIIVLLITIKNYIAHDKEKDIQIEKKQVELQKKAINNMNVRFCGNCGCHIEGNTAYCPNCGHKTK